MPDYQARLKDIEQRTDEALSSLEQDNQWAEALAVYHATGGEVDALAGPGLVVAHSGRRQQRAHRQPRAAARARHGEQGAGDFAPAGELARHRAHAARARAYEWSGDAAFARVALTAQRMAEAVLKREGHRDDD